MSEEISEAAEPLVPGPNMVRAFRNRNANEATIGAIRLTLVGAASDADALAVIKALVAQAPTTRKTSTASVALLIATLRRIGGSLTLTPPATQEPPAPPKSSC